MAEAAYPPKGLHACAHLASRLVSAGRVWAVCLLTAFSNSAAPCLLLGASLRAK